MRGQALAFFTEVIDKERSLEDAYTELLAFKKRQKWVPELRKLLDKQVQDEEKGGDLSLEKYVGQGQQRKHLDTLTPLVKRFMLLMDN